MALSRLLQLKSSLRIVRLGFSSARTRCCFSPSDLKEEAGVEETGSVAVELFLKESLGKLPTFVSHEKAKHTTLASCDLFGKHKDDQMETTEDHEGTKLEEKPLDVLLDYHAESSNSDSECSSHPNDPLPSEPPSDSVLDSQDGHLKELFPIDKCENDQSVSYDGGETSSLSSRTHKVLDVKDSLAKSANIQAAALLYSDEPSELSSEPHPKQDTRNMPDIKDLIDLIRVPIFGMSNSTSSCSNKKGRIEKNVLNDNLQKSDNSDNVNSRAFRDGTSNKIEDEKMSSPEIKPTDFTDAKASPKVSIPVKNKDQGQLKGTRSSRKETEENRVFVRFLYSYMPENHILDHFRSCGDILDIEYHNAGGSLFRSAYIYFKTREGLTKALQKSGSCLGRWTITVESANSKENVKIPVPGLIGDHDIPAALVKNPTRTIKIEQLTREISSYHIKEALAFCESNVSGYFLGPSHSVAYVEFETEIGKERALTRKSINVLRMDLVMLRIDSPRTTVVRISNTSHNNTKILSVCKSLGDVRLCYRRRSDILDVHFGFAEWPKMLEILNRLNGLEVGGTRLQAVPAPVYPPEVLLALWHEPEERKRLKATMQVLLRKLGEDKLDTSELVSSQHLFLDKIW